ncbi:putative chromo (CHRromatin Organisation MOdifier) domain containing protein [Lyophyllum shimeji]|uniref:RNA-directed DNA polymerase n=1 Tax=Lyophyllum shimeji TaxID=47721 RepID=A0A9P3PTB9_LYOSH|nr:putative chromo (CHRromatin Organisation MOdifier) domain containing protein [Lyophyllum shimeji]
MTNPPTLDHSVDEHPVTDTTSTEHAPTAGPGAADLIQLLHSISATQAQMLAYIEDRRRTTEGESRVAEPDKYNGNPKALDRFLMQLHLVFRSKPTTYADPNKRVIYALSFMKEGRAEKWAQGVLKRLEAGEVEWATWKDFEHEIQLERLQQGSRSAEEYFTEFEVYQHDSGYNDSALVRVLKRNLHPRLLEAIYNMNTLPDDDDFKGWRDLAIRKDRQRRELQMLLPTPNTSRPLDFRERDGLRGRDRGNFTDRDYGSVIDVVIRERQHIFIWDLLGRWRPNGDRPREGRVFWSLPVLQLPPRGTPGTQLPPLALSASSTAVRRSDGGRTRRDDTLRVSTTSDDVPRNSSPLTPSTTSDTLVTPESHINLAEDPAVTLYDKLGRAGRFLRRLKEEPELVEQRLRRWTQKSRHAELTVPLLQSLLMAPIDEAARTLDVLRGAQHQISRVGKHNSTEVYAALQTTDTGRTFGTKALIDSGATGCYIGEKYAHEQGLNLERLSYPIPVYNADNSPNDGGPISYVVTLRMNIAEHVETLTLAVTNTGHNNILLGHAWLRRHNPTIDWVTSAIIFNRCPADCMAPQLWGVSGKQLSTVEEDEVRVDEPTLDLDDEDRLLMIPDVHLVRAKFTVSQQIAEREAAKVEARSKAASIPDRYVEDFGSVFSKETFDELPPRRPWDHAIELKEGSSPFTSKIYPLSRDEQKQLDEFIEEHLRSGRIRPSKSPIASPFFFVKKKDGSLRPVQDYRRLNDITIKNRYPLPLVSEIIDKLRGAKYFTKFDVRWGYNNIRIREGDEWKAAFITNRGLYEPLVMFFGLTNSPATFQTMMNDIFRDLIVRGVVIVYMDDILIYTTTLEEHRKVTREVLEILKHHRLFLKPEKCEWEQKKILYLGVIVSEEGVEMDPAKVEAVASWPTPRDKHELQQFLGFANYYRRFVKDYSRIAWRLHRLTGHTPWSWGGEEQKAFENLRTAITTGPVLALPTDDDPYRVEADSSGYATGATLMQRQHGIWRPVAFLSQSLNDTERNYEIHDREMLAIMRALSEWRHYLVGAAHPVEILSDHQNLQYFMTARKLNRRQARWSLKLADYDFTLVHKPGSTMGKSDALSRHPRHNKGRRITRTSPYYNHITSGELPSR